MTGNITGPSNTEFYEDDVNFHEVSAQLTSGWGWGFNKAYAACEDEQSLDDDATTPDECIDVYGDPVEESSHQESSSEASSGGGGSDGGAGGGAGSEGEGDGTPEAPPEETPEECREEVGKLVQQCKDTYFYYGSALGAGCAQVTWGSAAAFCGTAVSALTYEAHKWCDAQGQLKIKNSATKRISV